MPLPRAIDIAAMISSQNNCRSIMESPCKLSSLILSLNTLDILLTRRIFKMGKCASALVDPNSLLVVVGDEEDDFKIFTSAMRS